MHSRKGLIKVTIFVLCYFNYDVIMDYFIYLFLWLLNPKPDRMPKRLELQWMCVVILPVRLIPCPLYTRASKVISKIRSTLEH